MRQVVAIAVGLQGFAGIAQAADANCESFVRSSALPDKFRMIGSADLPKREWVQYSDGLCVCDNTPAVDRAYGRTAIEGLTWACRVAGPEDQPSAEEGAE